jgi:alpha-tubulin suppressor-like RCC1 family protein
MLLCGLASGCDQLFALTHVNEPPIDAGSDAPAAPCEVRSIAVAAGHGCAADTLGDVYCWGLNDDGAVQPGGDSRVLAPTKIVLPGPADEVSAGKTFTCARMTGSGDVYCWGDNDIGQLGQGPADMSRTIHHIAAIPASAQIAVGSDHACSRSVVDGTIWCWGRNTNGQTGQSTSLSCKNGPCTLPKQVGAITGSKTVVVGHQSACIIDASDHLLCWGKNSYGQLGINSTAMTSTPTMVQIGTVRSVDISSRVMCAIDSMQRMWCAGEGENGQIGNGGFDQTLVPSQLFINKPTSISTTAYGACATTEDNSLACWGMIDPGDGKPGTYAAPHVSPVADVTQLTGRYFSTCGIANGGALCWGLNDEGQLGRGLRGISTVPQSIGVASPTSVAVGDGHGCVIANGKVSCWGQNDYAQAGSPSLTRVLVPTDVAVPITTPTRTVASFHKSCVWGGGEAACWGRAFSGQLGTGGGGRSAAPAKVLRTGIKDADRAIAIGSNHLCVVDESSTLTCYGNNSNGQLGDGTTSNSMAGVLAAISPVDQVAAGLIHTCARKLAATNQIWCWGGNNDGQLGDGTNGAKTTPINVNGVGDVSKIAAGYNHTCALNAAGEVWCWGRNNQGQVGNGTATNISTPARAVASGATDLVAGLYATCALVNGSWQCWGRNDDGQLANGTEVNVLAPTTSPGFASAAQLSIGTTAVCMRDNAGVSCAGLVIDLGTGDISASLPKAPALPGCQ